MREMLAADLKFLARWIGVLFSALSVLFACLTYAGVWNEWRGDNLVAAIASRFDTSYAKDVSRQVREGDKDWLPVMRLIKKYSHANLQDKKPILLARFPAIMSAKDESGAEWTAPTTPIVLIDKDPVNGALSPSDWRIVGTIEDLHNWVRADESDFDFLVRTIIFGILSVCVGVFLAMPDKPKPKILQPD
jgi:hypothetical protein